MADPEGVPFTVGLHGDYQWLVTEEYMDDLLRLCPEIVLGKYVAITSIDSGSFVPNKEEKLSGWETRDGIAYSPMVSNVESLPRENWDEWYVFNQPFRLGRLVAQEKNIFAEPISDEEVCVFVNFNMGLHRADHEGLTNLFWHQLARLRPQTYIAESDYHLTLVSSDEEIFAVAHQALRELNGGSSKEENS